MVALVTGSAKGIGKELIIKLSERGYDVVITYNNSKNEAELLKEYVEDNYNVNAYIFKCDISKEEDIISLRDYVINKYGKLDILINNAALSIDNSIDDKTKEEFMKVLEVNVVGTFLVTKYLYKYMDNGVIVNISSTNAIDTYYPESCDYDASKAGVISLTHNMAREFAPYIAVNCVCPGWVNTDMNSELTPLQRDEYNKKILLGRFANPQEIAKVVVFLTSDDASYINDSIIRVDGGKFNE